MLQVLTPLSLVSSMLYLDLFERITINRYFAEKLPFTRLDQELIDEISQLGNRTIKFIGTVYALIGFLETRFVEALVWTLIPNPSMTIVTGLFILVVSFALILHTIHYTRPYAVELGRFIKPHLDRLSLPAGHL